jgi:hypothetical protein
VRLKGFGKLKKINNATGARTRNLPAYTIVLYLIDVIKLKTVILEIM